MHQVIHDIRKTVKQTQPLIHCITNPISINQFEIFLSLSLI